MGTGRSRSIGAHDRSSTASALLEKGVQHMNARVGAGAAVVTVLAVAMVAPQAGARPAVAHAAAPAITQTYGCSTPVGDVDLTGTVTGKAKIKRGKINLSKVVYSVTNSVGL